MVVVAATTARFDGERFGAMLFAAAAAMPLAPLAFALAVVATVVASEKVIKEHKTPPVVYVRRFEVFVLRQSRTKIFRPRVRSEHLRDCLYYSVCARRGGGE